MKCWTHRSSEWSYSAFASRREVLSGLADIGRTHLSAIERGARKPTLETFFRIGEALGVRPSVLLAAIEEELAARASCEDRTFPV